MSSFINIIQNINIIIHVLKNNKSTFSIIPEITPIPRVNTEYLSRNGNATKTITI